MTVTTTQHEGFLQAVREAPLDDAPRLIYADWLEENGDGPRAEFIRLQCQRASLDPDDHRSEALRTRERQLILTNRSAWLQGFPGWAKTGQFHRGFWVPHLKLSGQGLLNRPAADFALAPLWSLSLAWTHGLAERLAACEKLLAFRSLDLKAVAVHRDLIPALAASPFLRHVQVLTLGPRLAGDDDVRRLAASASLTNLEVLSLDDFGVGAAGVEALVESPSLARLTDLSLNRNPVGAAGARLIGQASCWGRLRSLYLAQASLGSSGVAALAAGSILTGLRTLDLSHNGITDSGAEALALSPTLAKLEVLWLRGNRIGPAGARALAATAHLPNLKRLWLGDNPLPPQAVSTLVTRFGPGVTFHD